MGRTFLQWSVFGVAATLVLQPAQAGDRERAAVQVHHLGASIHRVAVVNRGENGGLRIENGAQRQSSEVRVGNPVHGEFSFLPVTPLGTNAPSPRDRGTTTRQGETGPSTSPRERKTITFFRLDPKFGDVAVQPVVGGVNGAQLSVGF